MGLQDVFSAIGKGLKAAAPYFQPVADHIAAAAGNYKPLLNDQHEAQQQREFGLQNQLAQSNLATQDLTRQHTQQTMDNTLNPDQQEQRALRMAEADAQIREKYAPSHVAQYKLPGEQGGVGVGMLSPAGKLTPAYTEQSVPNPTQTPGAGNVPPAMGHLIPPVPTAMGKSPVEAAPKIHFGVGGYDAEGNYVQPEYDAVGGGRLAAPQAPKPVSAFPKITSGTSESIQKDENGNFVRVPMSRSSTSVPAVPGGGGAPGAPSSTLPTVPQNSTVTPPMRPQGVGGSRAAQPVMGANGNQLHAPLGQAAKKTLQQIGTSDQMLSSVLPDLTQAVTDIGHGSNLYDAAKTRASWQEYVKGIDPNNIDPNSPVAALPGADPRITKMFPALAMMKVVLAQPFMNNSRNFMFMQQIQQHVPDPEHDTPQLMLSKAQWIKQAMPMIRKSVYDSEGIGTGVQNNPQPQQNVTPPPPATNPDEAALIQSLISKYGRKQ